MSGQAARKPQRRTITVELPEGHEFAGWRAVAQLDFPARLVLELETGKLGPILSALELIIVEHNLPDADGNVAAHLADVDPYRGLLAITAALTEAIATVPPR